MTPQLTQKGMDLILRAMDGEGITFTGFVLGNGDMPIDYKQLTALVNQQASIGIDQYDVEEDHYIKLKGTLQNNQIDASFVWTEVGITADDPDGGDDVLYAYAHYQMDEEEGQKAPALIPKYNSGIVEMELEYDVFVGDAEDVSAALAQSAVYATQQDLQRHAEDNTNPHSVTKTQVGLGNVPNVETNDQTPTYEVPGVLSGLSSGEKLSVAFGKLARGISNLIAHLADTTKHVTSAERNEWNGKAAGSHNHSASNITSGTLSAARGGTGVTTIQALAALVETHLPVHSTSATWTLKDGNDNVIATATAWIYHSGKVKRAQATFQFNARSIQKLRIYTSGIDVSYLNGCTVIARNGYWDMVVMGVLNYGNFLYANHPSSISNINFVDIDFTIVSP